MAERLSARAAIARVTSAFAELPTPDGTFAPDGPIAWQGYGASRARAAQRTGEEESVVCGTGLIGPTEAVLISFEFGFLGGSLGERTGDRLVAAYTYARERRLPVVSLIATGGSRMQEGMRALVQLQRVAQQSALTRAAGLPQLAVVRDPTTGGGWATLGAGADVVLALPGAQIGFAGSRVRPPDADPWAYTAEAQLAAGSIDAVVRKEELRSTLAHWLTLLTGGSATPPADESGELRPRTPASDLGPHALNRRKDLVSERQNSTGTIPPADRSVAPAPPPGALGRSELPGSGWDAVQQARSPARPRAAAYLDAYFETREAIHGDRCGGTDPGMLCGFGLREGRTVAYAAQCGTPTLPAGYRTAARLIRLADRLGVPVLTLVDTPGAANDAAAERAGAGAAIADLFTAIATARVPVTTLLIGEGGSGGALALSAPHNTWATPDSYFSVIAPELAAAILKRAPEDTRSTADQLHLRPQDLVELGVVRGIVSPDPYPDPETDPETDPLRRADGGG
jgi:acetyl-CoA carboxylase beta subunit